MATKEQVRNHYKLIRQTMPPELTKQLSMQISEHILHWEVYRNAEALYFYYPLGNEVSLLPVIEDALSNGRPTAFPKVMGECMAFYGISHLDELKEGCFHVMEPQTEGRQPVSWAHALCFVPGTAFDQTGGRFGYGKGYYDRFFSGGSGQILVGCAYGCQIAEALPTDRWDRKMDYLASETGIYGFKEKPMK